MMGKVTGLSNGLCPLKNSKVDADGVIREIKWSGIRYPVESTILMPIFIYNSTANINIFNHIKWQISKQI